MSEELKVPKQRAAVEVLLPGGAARQVIVFLSEFAPTHTGAERLSDLLNGGGDFVPTIDLASDTTTFLNRHAIAAARVSREWESDADLAAAEEHEVEITLADGGTLRGRIGFVPPHEHARLLEHLNAAQPFLRLAQEDKVALVNKRHIARVAKLK